MNRLSTAYIALLVTCAAVGQDPTPQPQPQARPDPTAVFNEAWAAYQAQQFDKAAKLFVKANEAGFRGPVAAYNAACSYALLGKKDEAFEWIEAAINLGWNDLEHLKTDEDFASLHGDPRWPEALQDCAAAEAEFAKMFKEPELRRELIARMREDQNVRMTQPVDVEKMREIDEKNTAWIKEVIARHGWPGRKMVGPDGAQAAFLLVQHSPDKEFMAKSLELLEKAWRAGEADGQHVALMTDRVLVAQGKPQRYGSQFQQVDGEMKPFPIEDEANVDARRKEMGMEPLADYAKRLRGQ